MSAVLVPYRLPAGQYRAAFQGSEPAVSLEHGTGFRLYFQIELGPYRGRYVTRLIEAAPSPASTDGRFLAKMLGRPLVPGEQVDFVALRGARFRVTVRTNSGGGVRVVSVRLRPVV